MSKDYPWGKGTPKWTLDATANDSDKTVYTVPAGKVAYLNSCWVLFVTSATVGNRKLYFEISDGASVVFVATHYISLTAGLTTRHVFTPYAVNSTSVGANATAYCGTGELILPAGYTVRLYDAAAVDAAADDMTVALHYMEYDA